MHWPNADEFHYSVPALLSPCLGLVTDFKDSALLALLSWVRISSTVSDLDGCPLVVAIRRPILNVSIDQFSVDAAELMVTK